MLQITNKYYNNKNKKLRDKINKKYLNIQTKRLAEKDKKPLSIEEQHLFEDKLKCFTCTELKNGFYNFNKVSHIIVPVPKMNINSFYNSCESILTDNPANTFLVTIIDEDTRRKIMKIGEHSRNITWARICVISPKLDYVKFIEVSIFNISVAYFGVCFDVYWKDDFVKEIDEMIVSKEVYKLRFKQIIVNGKKQITKGGNNLDCDRRRKVDDVLLEYKLKVYEYLSNYYELENCYKKMPLSLDEYVTNLDFEDRFIMSQEYSTFFGKKSIFEMTFHNNTNNFKRNCYFELFEENMFGADYRINRSRLLIYAESKDEINTSFDSLIFFYLTMIKKYALLEYDNLLMKKQEILNESCGFFPSILFGGYNKYLHITNKTNEINSILKKDEMEINLFHDFNYTNYDKDIDQTYEIYSNREKQLNEQISNILNIRSNRLAIYIAFISLIVAIIAIIVTIILSNNTNGI